MGTPFHYFSDSLSTKARNESNKESKNSEDVEINLDDYDGDEALMEVDLENIDKPKPPGMSNVIYLLHE